MYQGIHIINRLIKHEKLEWRKCVSITTDGTSAMVGKLKAFSSFVKKNELLVVVNFII